MGNGWLYIAFGSFCIISAGASAVYVITLAVVNVGVLHCIYPFIKRWVARPRPYQVDVELVPLLAVLDEHSFPSGHSMTLTAVSVPIVLFFPQTFIFAVMFWALMAWARLASAHHFPSDVVAGSVLGLSVSYPISVYGLAMAPLLSQ
jgi:undecaprenyl-diphosphatase